MGVMPLKTDDQIHEFSVLLEIMLRNGYTGDVTFQYEDGVLLSVKRNQMFKRNDLDEILENSGRSQKKKD